MMLSLSLPLTLVHVRGNSEQNNTNYAINWEARVSAIFEQTGLIPDVTRVVMEYIMPRPQYERYLHLFASVFCSMG